MRGRDPDIYRALLEHLSDGVMVIGFDGSVRLATANSRTSVAPPRSSAHTLALQRP